MPTTTAAKIIATLRFLSESGEEGEEIKDREAEQAAAGAARRIALGDPVDIDGMPDEGDAEAGRHHRIEHAGGAEQRRQEGDRHEDEAVEQDLLARLPGARDI